MPSLRLTLASLCLPLAAGCANFCPDSATPRTVLPIETVWSTYAGAYESSGRTAPLADRVADPQLSALIETALTNSPDLAAARARLAKARALSAADVSRFDPRLNAGGSVTASRQSETGLLPAGQIPGFETEQVIYSAGFDAAWEIDLFGRRDLVEELGTLSIAQQDLSTQALAASLTADVMRAYVEEQAAKAELDLLDEIIARQSELTEATRLRRDHGEASDLDVERAEAELAAQRARRPAIVAASALAELRLATLTGTPPSSDFTLSPPATRQPLFFVDVVLLGTTTAVLRRRPDVAQAELSYATNAAALDLQALDVYPTLSLFASAGPDTTDFLNLFDPASLAASRGGLVDWAVFDGGRREAESDAARARLAEADALYRSAVLRALEEVEAGAVALAQTRAELADRQDIAARRARIANMARARYEGGTGTLMSVLEAERDLADAEIAVTRLTSRAEIERIALEKALGSILPPFEPSNSRSVDETS